MVPGRSAKEQWKDDHNNFVTDLADNPDFLFVYSDRSLTEQRGRRRTGYSVIGYNKGEVVFKRNRALGEHVEVYDAEMMGIQIAAEETRKYMAAEHSLPIPSSIIFYTDNAGSIDRIFGGKPGKGQAQSRVFRKTIAKILNKHEDLKIEISWCPSHSSIIRNEAADALAKEGARSPIMDPNHKSQAYVTGLQKREMLETWRLRWTNAPNPPCSGFALANRLAPMLCTTKRFWML